MKSSLTWLLLKVFLLVKFYTLVFWVKKQILIVQLSFQVYRGKYHAYLVRNSKPEDIDF